MHQNYNHESYTRNIKFAHSSNKSFGLVIGLFFFLISFFPIISGQPVRRWSLIPSVLFILLALFKPALLSSLNYYWARFGLVLHKAISPIILAFLFYFVFAPTALILKLFKKDILSLKIKKNDRSYWIDSPPVTSSMQDQF